MKSKVSSAILLGLIAFSTYSCMYAIRKPFSAFLYDETLLGWNIKNWMVLAQLLGYTLSKFTGIRWIGKLNRTTRRLQLITMLFIAAMALWIIPFCDPMFWPILMLVNGFPLGMVWGIVFSYVEGRDLTEFIGAILACTFVFTSGFVKFLTLSMSEYFQMSGVHATATISALSCVLACFFSFFLEKIPGPTEDETKRHAPRIELSLKDQKRFFLENLRFLVPAIFIYMILTFLRDFRDNFFAELLNYSHSFDGATIAKYETIITLVLLSGIPLISKIRNHLIAIQLTFITALFGGILNLLSYGLYTSNYISGSLLVLSSGLGLYAGYILINISIMNRIVGYHQKPGNCGFLMYAADSSGYLVSLLVMGIALFQQEISMPWFEIYEKMLIAGSLSIVIIAIYPILFIQKLTYTLKSKTKK